MANEVHATLSEKQLTELIMNWSYKYQQKFKQPTPPISEHVAQRCSQSIIHQLKIKQS